MRREDYFLFDRQGHARVDAEGHFTTTDSNVFAQMVTMLLSSDYEVLCYMEENLYVINYCYNQRIREYGSSRFMLVSSEEEEEIGFMRLLEEEEEVEY